MLKTLEQKNYKIFKRFITMIKNFVHETSIIDEGAIIGKEVKFGIGRIYVLIPKLVTIVFLVKIHS